MIIPFQINGIQALAKCMGWNVLSSSTGLGCGAAEPLGNVTGCLLSNANGDRFIAVRHNPQSYPKVWVATVRRNKYLLCFNIMVTILFSLQSPEKPSELTSLVDKSEMPNDFLELNLDNMDGRNLFGKLELLMAALATHVEWTASKGEKSQK